MEANLFKIFDNFKKLNRRIDILEKENKEIKDLLNNVMRLYDVKTINFILSVMGKTGRKFKNNLKINVL